MTAQVLSYILSITGGLIVILLAIVGFWLSRYVKSTDELSKVVVSLRILVQSIITEQSGFRDHCKIYTNTSTKRFNSHAKRLDDHETRISVIEATK
jgi:hypothetical protein